MKIGKLFLVMALIIIVGVTAVDKTAGVDAVDFVTHGCVWGTSTLLSVWIVAKIDEGCKRRDLATISSISE